MKSFFHLTRTSALQKSDDSMYRTFGYGPLRKAPAENLDARFTAAERQALTSGQFALSTPPPAPPPPAPPPSPRPTSRIPLVNRRPAIMSVHPMNDFDGPSLSAERNNYLKWREDQLVRLVDRHVKEGTLTDGSEFLNLGNLVKNQSDLIAKEYAKWHEGGGGRVPDLSRYEDPVARYKDGSAWDYHKTADKMARLASHAQAFDRLTPEFSGEEPWWQDPDGWLQTAIDPKSIWRHIHYHASSRPPLKIGKTVYINPAELKRTGLLPHQYPSEVRTLMNLGLRHQWLSRLYAQGADDVPDPSGSVTELLPDAPEEIFGEDSFSGY